MLLKKFTGEEGERVDMQKLYGYIGLFTLVALWWLSKCRTLPSLYNSGVQIQLACFIEQKDQLASDIRLFMMNILHRINKQDIHQ